MYFSFSEFGIDEKDVLFVDPKYPRINDFMEDIISSDEIGIDTESIVARTKLNSEMSVLALIQVSTLNKVYIFDGLDCQNSIILEYISKYFDDPGKKVIGHTIKEDFKYTIKAFGYNKSPKC